MTKRRTTAGKHFDRTKPNRRANALSMRGFLTLVAGCLALCLVLGLSAGFLGSTEKPVPLSEEEFRPQVGNPPYTIAVDAGHGGTDPGAIGLVEERQMNAATARALTELLETDPNYLPVDTRDSYDTTASPSERAERANAQNADLLLSIHGNSSGGSSEPSGFECYPVTPGRIWHQESMYFAKLLAAGMEQAGSSLRGRGGVRYIYYDENGQKQLVEVTDDRVREEATFTILEQADCPAVLAEQCFVTNAEDVDRFGDEDGCLRSARIYYEAICAYFGTEPLEPVF